MKRRISPFGNSTVQLRLIEESDLETTLQWRNRDDIRVWFKTSTPLTSDQHLGWFRKYLERDDDFLFIVESDGCPVGQASVYGIDWQRGSAEVGRFITAPEAAGRGLMTQACAELLRLCAIVLGLKHVYLEVKESNARAIRVYQRNGFTVTGTSEGLIHMTRSLTDITEGSATFA